MKKIIFTFLLVTAYYCSYADSWTQKANFGGGLRGGGVGFSIGSKGYIGCGQHGNYYQDFWEWDPLTNSWSQKADLPVIKGWGAIGFSIGTKGYIGLGSDGGAYLNDLWEWDQSTNIWTQKADLTWSGTVEAIGFSIGTKGYIGTGYDFNLTLLNTFWEWDGDSSSLSYNTWTQKAFFGGAERWFAIGFSIGTKGYIGTGGDGSSASSVLSDFWEWDQTSNAWTQKANFGGGGRADVIGFSIGTKGYIGTGTNGTNFQNDFWEWDQSTNTWSQKATFPTVARGAAVGFSIGSKGYIGTGWSVNPSTFHNDFWEYCDTCAGVGINEINNLPGITVSPNPVDDKLKISLDKKYKNLKIEIYDEGGKKVFEEDYENVNSAIEINVSNFNKGIYVLKLSDENGSHTFKVLVD